VKTFRISIITIASIFAVLLSSCQIKKYDTFDAEKYAENNLDIEVLSIYCTGELGFSGSSNYNLEKDDREVCFILGETDNGEEVYSYGSKENTKLIQTDRDLPSSSVIQHLEEINLRVKHWKYIYVEELDLLGFYITTENYSEYFIVGSVDDYQYFAYSSTSGLISISEQEIIEIELDGE
jgi:hypothetical protein